MVTFKLTLSDKKGRSTSKELKDNDANPLLGLLVGQETDASIVGLQGKIMITGGSDKSGVPMRGDVRGMPRKRILIPKGVGLQEAEKGLRKLSASDTEKLEDKIFSKYDSIYDAAFDVARNGIEVIESLKLPKKTADAFADVSSKIKLPSVEIRGILEITDRSSNGVENIKKSLQGFEGNGNKDKVDVLYVGAPKYRISVKSSDFKSAENTLKPILETIQKTTEKNKGTFKFTREESKKTGGD